MKFFNHDLDFNFRNLEQKQIILIVGIIVSIIILITLIYQKWNIKINLNLITFLFGL